MTRATTKGWCFKRSDKQSFDRGYEEQGNQVLLTAASACGVGCIQVAGGVSPPSQDCKAAPPPHTVLLPDTHDLYTNRFALGDDHMPSVV